MRVNQRKSGVILSYVSQGISILSGLIYTPIMLRLLGQSEYGLYQLVYSVVSYLSLLSFGFSASYMRFYSRYKEKNEEEEVARLNGMFMTIFLIISCVCILCGYVMVLNIESIFGSGLTTEEYSIARVLMSLMIVNLALTFPNSVFDAMTSAHEQFFFQKLLSVLNHIMNPFLTLPLLIMGYGSIGMVSVTTFLTLAKLIVNGSFCIKKLKVKFIFRKFNFSLFREMGIFTFFIFLNQIVDQVNWNVDKFLLGRFAGTVAVAVYGVGGQINSMYLSFSTTISHVYVPLVNKIVATTDDNKELTKLFTKVGRIQFLILGLILTGFIFFGQPFIRFWAGTEYSDSYYVALLLICPATVSLVQNLGLEIQRAKNKHRARSIVYTLISVGNVCISIPLIQLFGVTGAALGTTIALVCGNIIFMNWYYYKKLEIDIPLFWRSISHFIPALVAPCLFGVVRMALIPVDSIGMLFALIIVYTIIYSISMLRFGMNDDEKNIVIGPLKRLLKKCKRW